MSRILDALRQAELQGRQTGEPAEPSIAAELLRETETPGMSFAGARKLSISSSIDPHVAALSEPMGLAAEKFRVLATRLSNMRRTKGLKKIHITSSVEGDGKSLVAVNLAITLSKRPGNNSVLLLEGDMRKPSLCSLFGIETLPGIADWWTQSLAPAAVTDSMRQIGDLPLYLLPGGISEQPIDILQSTRFTEMVDQLGQGFDWVVIDSPPLMPMADANLLARLADGTLLVVRAGSTPIPALEKGMEYLDNPKLIGVVLNDAPESEHVNGYYHYYSARRYQAAATNTPEGSKA